jgi:hypothetical protein
MICKYLFCILISILISGCAVCSPVTNVKAIPITFPDALEINSNIVSTRVKLPNKFNLIIRRCADRRLKYDSSICGAITVRPNVHIRFGSSQAIVTSMTDGKKDIYEMSTIKYSYRCNTKKGERPICDSPTESPTGKPTIILGDSSELTYGSDNEMTEFHARAFEPTLEFVGAKVKCWCAVDAREYTFTIIDQQLLGKPPVNVRLPSIWVDGQEYVLPEFNFSTATEDFCYRPELM